MDDLLEAYGNTRAWLAFLIDHPDKAVSVDEYRAQIRAAQDANNAAHKAWMGAWA